MTWGAPQPRVTSDTKSRRLTLSLARFVLPSLLPHRTISKPALPPAPQDPLFFTPLLEMLGWRGPSERNVSFVKLVDMLQGSIRPIYKKEP